MLRIGRITSISTWRWPFMVMPPTKAPPQNKITKMPDYDPRAVDVPTHNVRNAPLPSTQDFSVPAHGPSEVYG